MYRMVVEGHFSAAHEIRGHTGLCCKLHGHNYRVVVHLAGSELNELGMLIDYGDVKHALGQVLQQLDHSYLNEIDPFTIVNPTSEEIARVIYTRLRDMLLTTDDLRRRVHLQEVVVYETEKQGVGYGE
ncbi:MAG: 6-carboxytetrahydropterin synthase QueD [Armatimonadota bacterium]